MNTTYGDISPRTAAWASAQLLDRGIPYLVFERYGQARPIPTRSSKVAKFRRFNALDFTPNVLTEGVTPVSKRVTVTDVTATLVQYGDLVTITDVVLDTHEDPVMAENTEVLGEQAAQMIETVRFNILKAGTNVQYANGSSRSAVNTVLSLSVQRLITRTLNRQNAKKITRVVRSTPSYGTQPIAPSFVAICHSDLEGDVRNMAGFTPPEEYGSQTPWENEIGKVENVRYVTSTLIVPWEDVGGTPTGVLSTTGSSADVYPILYVARDAYGIVPLKGKAALTPMVVNPKPSDSDPLAQRGHISWKAMTTAVILNDLWMVRGEVAVSSAP